MLQSPIKPPTYSLRGDRRSTPKKRQADEMDSLYDEEEDHHHAATGGGGGKQRGKSRRELPTGAVATLKAWLLSPEHFTHPYPTPQDQAMLMQKTGIDKKQLKNWFTNARRRIWKPMLKKQIEQGKIPGAPTGLIMPGATATQDNPHSVQAMRVHYQQASQDIQNLQQQQQQQQAAATVDAYGNPLFSVTNQAETSSQFFGTSDSQQQSLVASGSIGTLAQMASSAQLSKTDSHAILMELFARDQDLVRQATESARLKAENKQQPAATTGQQPQQQPQQQSPAAPTSQHPMIKAPSSGVLQNVPTLNSWPHFSSITSLNNLGTLPGVKSIASLSGADLASKGNVNKMGNLAQVKSMESMGKNDSYAFLEVFFGDRSSGNLNGMGGGAAANAMMPKGMQSKQGDEDNEIGLSLDDESPSQAVKKEFNGPTTAPASVQASVNTSMMISAGHLPPDAGSMDASTLKRAYDDALAARGLMSVSRSCEKLTDLPAKIQRTLSQSLLHKEKEKQAQETSQSYTPYSPTSGNDQQQSISQQYPGQQAVEPQTDSGTTPEAQSSDTVTISQEDQVQVPSWTACAICKKTNVDSQLKPCGHYFHERCLKPSIHNHPLGKPKCPVDEITLESVVVAVPERNKNAAGQQQQTGFTRSSSQTLAQADA